jgi:hypothetical protein
MSGFSAWRKTAFAPFARELKIYGYQGMPPSIVSGALV